MLYIVQVALGKLSFLKILWQRLPNPRWHWHARLIHAEVLARGQLIALDYLENNSGVLTVNLGNEKPYGVLDAVRTLEKVSGIKIPYQFVDRRPGDLPIYFANSQLAKKS